MASITLNGTVWGDATRPGPDTIDMTLIKVGTSLVAADGSRTFMYRNFKRQWTLGWNLIEEARRNDLRAVGVLTTSFVFVDQVGVSRTAQIEDDGYQESIAAIGPNGVYYYGVTMLLHEA